MLHFAVDVAAARYQVSRSAHRSLLYAVRTQSQGGHGSQRRQPSVGRREPRRDRRPTYSRSPKNPALQQLQKSSKSASTTPQRPIWNSFATVGVRDFWENGCRAVPASARSLSWAAGGARAHQAHPLVVAAGIPWILWGATGWGQALSYQHLQEAPVGSMVSASKLSIRTLSSACQTQPAFPAETYTQNRRLSRERVSSSGDAPPLNRPIVRGQGHWSRQQWPPCRRNASAAFFFHFWARGG